VTWGSGPDVALALKEEEKDYIMKGRRGNMLTKKGDQDLRYVSEAKGRELWCQDESAGKNKNEEELGGARKKERSKRPGLSDQTSCCATPL